MAKKKKKVSASVSKRNEDTLYDDDGDALTLTPPATTVASSPVMQQEVLSMHLRGVVGKSAASSTQQQQQQPRVIMTASDAILINAQTGDKVLLLRMTDDADNGGIFACHAATILHMEIHSEKQHNMASPVFKKPCAPLSPGTVQVTSSSVLDCLMGSLSKSCADRSSLDLPVKTTLTPTTTTTSSPTAKTAHFSFQDFPLDTPSPPSRKSNQPQSSSSTTSKSRFSHNQKHQSVIVSVIAVRSTLGQRVTAMLLGGGGNKTQQCSSITSTKLLVVEPVRDSNDAPVIISEESIRSCRSILERLLLAYNVGCHVQRHQILRISFRGQPVHFRLVRAEMQDTKNDSVRLPTDSFSKITLEDTMNGTEEEDDDALPEEAKSVLSAVLRSELCLYEITSETAFRIEITTEDKLSVSTNDWTMPVLQKPPKQYVAGLTRTIEEVRSLLLVPLSRPELFIDRNMKAPRGVLLHGPSGVGKTLLAQQLAHEISSSVPDCQIEYVPCSSLQSKSAVVGEAEGMLTRLFQTGSSSSSSSKSKLLIFDDIHLICSRRGGNYGTDRLAATLLALMDGIQSSNSATLNGTIVILAITWNPSSLDPALRRPGRLDTEVEVPLPDEASTRADILQFQLRSLGASLPDIMNESEWLELGRLAKGFNGADCMLAVKEAIRTAILERDRNETKDDESSKKFKLKKKHLEDAIRSIKPSAIKSITIEIPQVHWSSIGGMDSVKRELREAIELPLTHGEYFEQLRVPPPRGILLYGPPGCSKTLMARALATEGNMNFLAVKGPELLSKWLGESERALASLFRRARMASPAIIFFDEIDAIASKRGSGDSASSGRLLSQLLTELDGVNHTGSAAGKNQRVVVVGATNRPDLLDSALTRPGRIDRMIYVGVPDSASRARILDLSLKDKSCGDAIDIPHLASDEVSHGFSGAEIVAICRDAALLALEESDTLASNSLPKIEMCHLELAMKGMQRQITPSMVNFYASYHEGARSSATK